jgi:hypothetical protein
MNRAAYSLNLNSQDSYRKIFHRWTRMDTDRAGEELHLCLSVFICVHLWKIFMPIFSALI